MAEAINESEATDSFEDTASPQAGMASQETPKELKPKPAAKEVLPPPSIPQEAKAKENSPAQQNTVQPAIVAKKRSDQGLSEEMAVEADEAAPAPASPKFAKEKKEGCRGRS